MGTGQIRDANRIAARLSAICGPLTKEEAAAVLQISVAEQNEAFAHLSSLTKQGRDILPHPETWNSIHGGAKLCRDRARENPAWFVTHCRPIAAQFRAWEFSRTLP